MQRYQHATLLKTLLLFSCELLKNKILQNYFARQLRRAPFDGIIIARFFCKIYSSLKWKIKGCQ